MEGFLEKIEGGYVVRFERKLKHPVEKVWAAITQPERLKDWLAQADIEMVEGGKIKLQFDNTGDIMNGKVTHVNPPTLFEYTWNSMDAADSLVRWELQPEQDGCLLVLTHRFSVPDSLSSMMAGWHVHLDILTQTIMGKQMEWPWGQWEAMRDRYDEKLASGPIAP